MTLGSDAVEFEWNGSGIGAVAAGLAVTHRRTPPPADAGPVEYFIRHTSLNQWERGAGIWSDTLQTLTRVTVIAGSSGTSFVAFSSTPLKIVSWVMGKETRDRLDAIEAEIAAALAYTPVNF